MTPCRSYRDGELDPHADAPLAPNTIQALARSNAPGNLD